MYLDSFTLSALVDELLDTITGGRIQDVIDVDEAGIGLEIYGNHHRHYLYLSANNNQPRMHLMPDKLRRGLPKPTQIGLLLRRFAEGGVIAHISQPEWERIVILDVEGAEGNIQIVVEPMERRANVLLLKDGIIQDCMRRVPSQVNRYRTLLPNQIYQLPPPQTGKISPFAVSESEMAVFFAEADPKSKAQQVLTGRLFGISPLLAREVLNVAGCAVDIRADQVPGEKVFATLQRLVEPLRRRDWKPGTAESSPRERAYSVYPLTTIPNWRPVETISAAMAWYFESPLGKDSYDAAKQPVRDAIAEGVAKLGAKIASLSSSLKDDREREILRQSGELILAYQYSITSEQAELRAQYDLDAPELVIALDTSLTPLENAQRYFDRYNRAKRALEDVPRLLRDAQAELATVKQLATDLELATNWPEIDEVQQALQAFGLWRGKPMQKIGGGKSAPLKVVTGDQFVIWVGRNSRQNEQVTFDKGSPADLWLHARGVPGAHVIIKFDGRQFPDAVIERAAQLAAYYSALQAENRAEVDVTERRHVKKMRSGGQGMVTYRNERTIPAVPTRE